MIRRRQLALAAGLSLLVFGCRDTIRLETAEGSPAPVRPGTLTPCDLAPVDEVRRVLGGLPVRAARAVIDSPSPDFARCVYAYGESNPTLVVSIELRRFPSADKCTAVFEGSHAFLGKLARQEVEPMPGLGEGAVWAGGSVSQLHARRGDMLMIVMVDAGEPDYRRTAARGIAGRALARLAGEPVPLELMLDRNTKFAPVAPPPNAQ